MLAYDSIWRDSSADHWQLKHPAEVLECAAYVSIPLCVWQAIPVRLLQGRALFSPSEEFGYFLSDTPQTTRTDVLVFLNALDVPAKLNYQRQRKLRRQKEAGRTPEQHCRLMQLVRHARSVYPVKGKALHRGVTPATCLVQEFLCHGNCILFSCGASHCLVAPHTVRAGSHNRRQAPNSVSVVSVDSQSICKASATSDKTTADNINIRILQHTVLKCWKIMVEPFS